MKSSKNIYICGFKSAGVVLGYGDDSMGDKDYTAS